jgi:tripartite-type tricarboxylate transporter receptor subunit TctC
VPSGKEAGMKDFIMAWWSVHTPAKVPEPILGKLESWFNAIVADPETEKFLVDSGSEPLPGNRKLVREMLTRDLASWARWVKIANIQPQ